MCLAMSFCRCLIIYSFHFCNIFFLLLQILGCSPVGGGSIEVRNTNRTNKLIRKAGSVIGCTLDTMEAVVERRALNKLVTILDNTLSTLQLCCHIHR